MPAGYFANLPLHSAISGIGLVHYSRLGWRLKEVTAHKTAGMKSFFQFIFC